MAILTRDQILAADDIHTEVVPVPEWGGEVIVRSLTAGQLERVQQHIQGKGMRGVIAQLASLAMVDEHGKRLFLEGDIERLSKKSMAALNRVMKVVQKMNAITQEDMDELAKNSEDGQGDGSLSD